MYNIIAVHDFMMLHVHVKFRHINVARLSAIILQLEYCLEIVKKSGRRTGRVFRFSFPQLCQTYLESCIK